MSSFTRSLRLEQILPAKQKGFWARLFPRVLWKTTRGFIYCVGAKNSSVRHEVPCDFETDLASIPRLLWWLVGHPAGIFAQAAVLHDFLYKTGAVSRKRADEIFLEAMGVLNVPAWQQQALYRGVRIGGWRAWDKHRKNDRKVKDAN